MSRTSLVAVAGLLGVAFAAWPAAAQNADPFGRSDCREARLDQVVAGRTVSSQPVILCKPTQKVKSLVMRATRGPIVVATTAAPAFPLPPHPTERVAFDAAHQTECARLDCPTFVLSGVGF